MENLINDDLNLSSSDHSDNESDNEYDRPQTLLEECKYVIRKNKMENLINDI